MLGDGVNIAARLEGLREPGGVLIRAQPTTTCAARSTRTSSISEISTSRSRAAGAGLCAQYRLGNLAARALRLQAGKKSAAAPLDGRLAVRQYRRRHGAGAFRRRGHREPHDRPLTDTWRRRDRPQYRVHLQRQAARRENDRARVRRSLRFGGQRSAQRSRMRVNVQLTDAETAIIFGRSGSTSRWPTYSTCRTRSSRGSPIRWTRSS